jgi:uncharacterized protein
MTDNRESAWVQLFSGKPFWPLGPRTSEIEITDIAHSLSMLCRFNGHCIKFYSVAEHCVLLARHLRMLGYGARVALWGLLHDAPEAYVGDLVRPLKQGDLARKRIELRLMYCVCEKFELTWIEPAIVTLFDLRILGDERANMAPSVRPWGLTEPPLGVQLNCWSPEKAESEFLGLFAELISDIELSRNS